MAERELRFVPLLGALSVALVPIVGIFATMLSGIWLVLISLMLFARSQAVARLWEHAAADEPRHTVA